ncbi:MAG TPA: hypothetical protein VGN26_11830 [Armatimonadota bacterium]
MLYLNRSGAIGRCLCLAALLVSSVSLTAMAAPAKSAARAKPVAKAKPTVTTKPVADPPAGTKITSLSMKMAISLKVPAGQAQQLPPGFDKMQVSVWCKGKMSRLEMPMGMGVVIGDGTDYYFYNPVNKSAKKLSSSELSQMSSSMGMMTGGVGTGTLDDMRQRMTDLTKTSRKVGTSTVEGRACTVYVVNKLPGTDQPLPTEGGMKMHVANSLPIPMPVKLELQVPMGPLMTMTMKDIKFNSVVDDQLFKLPEGTQVEPMTPVVPVTPSTAPAPAPAAPTTEQTPPAADAK